MLYVVNITRNISVNIFKKTEGVVGKKVIQRLGRVFPKHVYKLSDIRLVPRFLLKGQTNFVIIIILVALITIVFHRSEILSRVSNEIVCYQNHTQKVKQACKKIAQKNPKHLIASKNADHFTLVKQNYSRKNSLFSEVKEYLNKIDINNPNNHKTNGNFQIAFYRNFIQNLEALAVDEISQCHNTRVQQIQYPRALKIYKVPPFSDFFVLTKIGYFLANRDKDYQGGMKVFGETQKKIENYNKHILLREIRHFYCSKASKSYKSMILPRR